MKKYFILGNPRSGTSLLRIVLNAHPNIIAPPESGFLQWWFNSYKEWPPEDIEAFAGDIHSSKKFETWNISIDELVASLETNAPNSYGEACALIYLHYARSIGKSQIKAIIDKNNYYIHHIPEIRKIWPDANFIHLVRDGRDVACSYLELKDIATDSPYRPKLPEDVASIAREWVSNNQLIERELSDIPERRLLIRYEDLISEKRSTLDRILEFADLEWSDQLDDHTSGNDEPASTMDWKKRTRGPFDPARVGRYRSCLSDDQISTFEKLAGSALEHYGYSIETH